MGFSEIGISELRILEFWFSTSHCLISIVGFSDFGNRNFGISDGFEKVAVFGNRKSDFRNSDFRKIRNFCQSIGGGQGGGRKSEFRKSDFRIFRIFRTPTSDFLSSIVGFSEIGFSDFRIS